MGINGPKPKDDPVRRNKPTFDQTNLSYDGIRRGPDLPEDVEWHPRTEIWWEMWRMSAQAQVMDDSDWEHMMETAFLHTRFWEGRMSAAQHVALAGELRQRQAALGNTFEARLKLRMVIDGDQTNIEDEIDAAAREGIDYFEKLTARAAELREAPKDE